MDYWCIEKTDISYLEKILLDKEGCLRAVPYNDLEDVPQEHLSQFCAERGFYCIPTIELIHFLMKEINGKRNETIEIGAGCGVIGKSLHIKSTDNYMQIMPKYKRHYEQLQQAIVPYGNNVERIDAIGAVKKYKPEIVIGAWCTHKYNPQMHHLEGNELGINEKEIVRRAKKYIHIGNEITHKNKPILDLPHRTIKEEWILSRSQYKDNNIIWIWE